MKSVGISKSWAFVLATVALVGCNADQEPASEASDGGARDASAEASQLPDAQVDGATRRTSSTRTSRPTAPMAAARSTKVGTRHRGRARQRDADARRVHGSELRRRHGEARRRRLGRPLESVGSQVFTAKYADVSPVASRGRGFVLSRSDDRLLVLDSANPSIIQNTIPLSEIDAGGARTLTVWCLISGSKAYVPLFGKNQIAIVDVDAQDAGVPTTSIDLAQFVERGDPDGLVDVSERCSIKRHAPRLLLVAARPRERAGSDARLPQSLPGRGAAGHRGRYRERSVRRSQR